VETAASAVRPSNARLRSVLVIAEQVTQAISHSSQGITKMPEKLAMASS